MPQSEKGVWVPLKDLAELESVQSQLEHAMGVLTICAASLTPSKRSDDPDLHGAVAEMLANDLHNDLDVACETLANFRKAAGEEVADV